MINDFIEFVKAARLFIFLSGKRETDLAHVLNNFIWYDRRGRSFIRTGRIAGMSLIDD